MREHVYTLLKENRNDMNLAYMNSGDGFAVALKTLFKPEGVGLGIKTSISFTKEKISGSMSCIINENQTKLEISVK